MEAVFRTCAQTGLKVDRQAERLIKVHAVAGGFAILFGGIAAGLVLLAGWAAFGRMVAGARLIDIAILAGRADVMMTSYAPLQAVSYFYLGWILFAVGALIGVCNFFASLVVARSERTYEGSIPLVTFGAATAGIIAVFTLAHGAIIYIPTWLWSLGIISNIDPGIYRLVWWGLGHSSQH